MRIRFLMIASVLVLSCGIQGCFKDEWYDVKTDKNISVPSSYKDLQALLDNADLFNTHSPIMSSLASDEIYFSEETANRLSGFERNSYTWSVESANINVGDWFDMSTGSARSIYIANLVLEINSKLMPVNTREEAQKNSIDGQALFFRSVLFYELAQQFAPPFDENIKDKKLGIPLRLESDINVKSVRSTVGETYSRIINDLKLAIELLKDENLGRTRPSSVAALAMLARVYLSMGNYTEALKFSDLALEKHNKLIDYNSLDLNSSDYPFEPYNQEIIFYKNMAGGVYFYKYYALIQKELYDLYHGNDLRKKAFFQFDPVTNTVLIRGTYAGGDAFHFFSGLASDELYLIRSECYARANNVTDAMKDLNKLLKSRFVAPYTDVTAADSDEALRIILDERKKELILRGTRWADLRRLNRDARFVQTFTRIVNDKTYTLEPNSYKYTFPIPDDIVQITGMEQNPGW